MNNTLSNSQFATDREAFFKRLETKHARDKEVQAVYAAHMTKAAEHFYLAGEAVKRGEFGFAQSQHVLAFRCVTAANKALPDIHALGAAAFAPVV